MKFFRRHKKISPLGASIIRHARSVMEQEALRTGAEALEELARYSQDEDPNRDISTINDILDNLEVNDAILTDMARVLRLMADRR